MNFNVKTRRSQLPKALLASLAVLSLVLVLPVARAQQSDSHQAGPAHTYRLILSLIHSDNGKSMNVQHYAMTIVAQGKDCSFGPGPCHATMKWGSKHPVMTGGVAKEAGGPGASQYQFTYIDVGLNLDARLSETPEGLELSIKAENSSIADPGNVQELKDPVVMQGVLESSTIIKPGVPVIIGSLDAPGTTQHVDVEVKLEPVS